MVILSHFDKIYATYQLKLGIDQRREKEGVVILSHFYHRYYIAYGLGLGTSSRERIVTIHFRCVHSALRLTQMQQYI